MLYVLLALGIWGSDISNHLQDKSFKRPKAENAHMDNCFFVEKTNKYKCEAK